MKEYRLKPRGTLVYRKEDAPTYRPSFFKVPLIAKETSRFEHFEARARSLLRAELAKSRAEHMAKNPKCWCFAKYGLDKPCSVTLPLFPEMEVSRESESEN